MTSVYAIDSSSLINLHRQIPRDAFSSVWCRLESEINANRLIAPREVRKEIEKKNDALSQWISEHPGMFVKDSADLKKIAVAVGRDWSSTVKDEECTDDLWVIALARLEGKKLPCSPAIVAQEKARGRQHKIPFIALEYCIESIQVLDMFRREKWTF